MNSFLARTIGFFSQPRPLALALVACSVAALGFAYISEYVFNHLPCPLCLWQRKPYFAAIALAALAFILQPRQAKATMAFLFLTVLALLAGSGIAAFHSGVELGWWPGLQSCGDSRLPDTDDIEILRAYLKNRPIVDCRVPGWQLFGISMTQYNLLYSTGLALAGLFLILRGRKKL